MDIRAAVVFEKSGMFNIESLNLAEPRDEEVLVRLVGVGICHTDLAGRDQHLPIPLPSVFGHEGAGVVERVGARVNKVKPGDHVILSWGSCGACASCKSGFEAYCRNFFAHNFSGGRADGSTTMSQGERIVHGSFFGQSSFANYALADERNLVKVREDVPLEILGPLGCGVMTGAGAVMNALHPRAGSSIAVFGTGTVGISAIMAALVCGCTVIIAVDINADRLETSRTFGATHTINARETDPVAAIRDITGGGADFTLECVGSPPVFRQAVEALGMLGICGLLGVAPFGVDASLEMQTILNGRTVRGILGAHTSAELFIPVLIELFMQGRFPFDRLIQFYPFDQINQAVSDMESGKTIKPVLRF